MTSGAGGGSDDAAGRDGESAPGSGEPVREEPGRRDAQDAGDARAAPPGDLLTELAVLRRQARTARRAYWFPLALFGLIGCGAIPFYLAGGQPHRLVDAATARTDIPALPVEIPGGIPAPGDPLGTVLLGFYWMLALVGAFLLMVAWYRRHARRAGVTSPARGAAITGIVITVLALVLWPVSQILQAAWLQALFPWFLTIHGMYPFLIIGVSLCVLAWAERSWGLGAVAVIYLAASVVACSYDVENIVSRLGYFSSSTWFGVLPNLALPVLVLLLSATVALSARHWRAAR